MRRRFCLVAVAALAAWGCSPGCSPTARDRVMRFFFEIPEEGATTEASDTEPSGQPEALPTIHVPDTRFASLHEPVRQRNCNACHDSSSRMHVRSDFMDVCATCHPRFFSDEVGHDPAASGECMECHVPHRSEHRFLLARTVLDTCVECHDGPEDLSEESHSGTDADQCSKCHDPHFGEAPFLKAKTIAKAKTEPRP